MRLFYYRSVILKAIDHCGWRLVLPCLAMLSFLLLLSCSSKGDDPLPAAPVGASQLASFSITITNDDVTDKEPACEIIETSTGVGGSVYCTYPAGTDPSITATFTTTAGGTTKISGSTVTSPVDINLSAVTQIIVTDASGHQRVYTLDIRDSGLPSVYITTLAGAPIPTDTAKTPITGTIKIMPSSYQYADPYAKIGLAERTMKIRGRGNSTWSLPKKPYRVDLDEAGSVLGLCPTGGAIKWVLLANHADKSLIRNNVAFKTAKNLMTNLKWTPNTLPVDLYVNGVYQGSYSMGDQVEVGAERVNIETDITVVDTGYLLEANARSITEGTVVGVGSFRTLAPCEGVGCTAGIILDYKAPKMVADKMAFINPFVLAAEDEMMNHAGTTDHIDVPSFIDWLIIEELFKNTDSLFNPTQGSSAFMHKHLGVDLLEMGPIWDFDLSAGNASYMAAMGDGHLNESFGWYATYGSWFKGTGATIGLLENAAFKTALKARWKELYDGGLEAKVLTEIDTAAARVIRSQKMNFAKWDIMDFMEDIDSGWATWFVTPDDIKALDTYEKHVAFYKLWISNRINWMNTQIKAIY